MHVIAIAQGEGGGTDVAFSMIENCRPCCLGISSQFLAQSVSLPVGHHSGRLVQGPFLNHQVQGEQQHMGHTDPIPNQIEQDEHYVSKVC